MTSSSQTAKLKHNCCRNKYWSIGIK